MDPKAMQEFKHRLYEYFAQIGKALGNARRLEILDLLAQAEHSVEALADKTQMSVASVSQHLQVLRGADLVRVRRVGTYAYYQLADDEVLRAWQALSQLAQSHSAAVDSLIRHSFEERQGLATITAVEVLTKLEAGSAILLDARPTDEYQAGHLPGAISMPAEELPERFHELPAEKEIIAYCRTSYCLLSDEAALFLQAHGYNVRVFSEGFPHWRALGLPYETSQPGTQSNNTSAIQPDMEA
jgi:rhodanese-related sulfurtransferase/biotin operon repressor